MDGDHPRIKQEAAPVQPITPSPSTNARGRGRRGRGRGRGGRGRRVLPAAVARRKPRAAEAAAAAAAVAASNAEVQTAPKPTPSRGRNRSRGRGRGGAASYAASAVGLGQIAPTRPTVSRAPSSAGSAVTRSNRSASTGGSVLRSDVTGSSEGGIFPATEQSLPEARTSVPRAFTKSEPRTVSFEVYDTEGADSYSDDDPVDPDLAVRNIDLAPWPGHLTHDGTLLPVSLPGLRDLGAQFEEKLELESPDTLEPLDELEPLNAVAALEDARTGTKPEPMEIDSVVAPVAEAVASAKGSMPHPMIFPKGSMARCLLESDCTISLLQLPGLLALTENPAAAIFEEANEPKEDFSESSVAAAAAAAERMRGLGTDLRKVGNRGDACRLGKLRFFKSGRVEMVMEKGGVLDLEQGVVSNKSQQLVLIDAEKKTCEEVQSSVSMRLVAVPALEDL